MNRKGFTLVELLGVVTILAMLGLIIVPTINKVLKDNKNKLYDVQIKNIENGAKNFVADNIFYIDIPVNSSVGITLGDLKNLGYVDKEIANPINGYPFSDSLLIIITNTTSDFDYFVCENGCDTNIPLYGDNCAEIFC